MTERAPKITSNFALLDIKLGREQMRKLIEDKGYKVPVQIVGDLVGAWSHDDGTSIEFEVRVGSVELGEPHSPRLITPPMKLHFLDPNFMDPRDRVALAKRLCLEADRIFPAGGTDETSRLASSIVRALANALETE